MKGDVQRFIETEVDKKPCLYSRWIHILATTIPTLYAT